MYDLFGAALDGVAFSGISAALMLIDIVENPVEMDVQTVPLAFRPGLRRTVRIRQSLTVRLEYMIRTQDIVERRRVRDRVAEWAETGGVLTVNTRPGQRLCVVLDKPPALNSSMKWTEKLTVEFTAYERPYWESASPVAARFTVSAADEDGAYRGTQTLSLWGSPLYAPGEFSFRNDSPENALTTLKVTAGKSLIELQGLQVLPGKTVCLSYGTADILGITIAETGESLLHCRTAESSDDLSFEAGAPNDIRVESDCPISGTITTREWWL